MLLPSAARLTPQTQQATAYKVNAAIASAAKSPAVIPQRSATDKAQSVQQPWVSNEQLWRQSIQHKHAQRRRMQQLQRTEQLPALALQSCAPQSYSSLQPACAGASLDSAAVLGQQQPQQQQQQQQQQHASQDYAEEQPMAAQLHHHQQQQQQHVKRPARRVRSAAKGQTARALTKALGTAGDAGQLLFLLLSAQQQCDAIHVSAAVNQCARGLILDLQLPAEQHTGQLQQQAVAQEDAAQLHWLNSLSDAATLQEARLWSQQPQTPLMQQQQQQQVAGLSSDWLLLLLLCQLVQQHASAMSSQQLCTCLSGLTQLLQEHTHIPLLLAPPFRTACQQLLLSAQAQLQCLDPRGLSLALHAAAGIACSRSGFTPASGFMLAWYRASRGKLQRFNHLDLAMTAGALGRMQMYPPAEWMTDFWTATQAALPTFPAHELLLLLLGVAGTGRKPPPGWRQAAAATLQPTLSTLSPVQLSTAVMAMAKLQHVPSTAWLKQFWQSWEAQQLQFSARSHASVIWAIGTIHPLTPHRNAWIKKLQAACQQTVAQATTAVAAVALQKIQLAAHRERLVQQEQQKQAQQQQQDASAQEQQLGLPDAKQGAGQALQLQQHQHQQQSWEDLQLEYDQQEKLSAAEQQQLIEEQPQLLASASLLHPTDCAMVVYGLARLGPSCLNPSFPAFWLAQSRSQLVNMNSQELATCLWALAKLRLLPPEAWLQQHLQCSARMASVMSHQQLAMVWWGCAKLRYLPNVSVTAELLMSAAEQLPSFSPNSLSLMLWSLGALRMRPNKEWMQLALAHVHTSLMSFDGEDFCGVLVGLCALGYHPGDAWLDTFTGTLATKIHLVSPTHHQRITAMLRAFGYNPLDKGFAWVMDPAAVAMMCGRMEARKTTATTSNTSKREGVV